VRHANSEDLDRLEVLLVQLRGFPELKERRRGNFTRGSRAFLHFHADDDALFADVRISDSFERYEVTTPRQQRALVRAIGQLRRRTL
jgi:hypothetical protein